MTVEDRLDAIAGLGEPHSTRLLRAFNRKLEPIRHTTREHTRRFDHTRDQSSDGKPSLLDRRADFPDDGRDWPTACESPKINASSQHTSMSNE
jgi:hypothetical protein